MGRGIKWHQAGIRYFHNLLTVPWGIELWASWDFHHLRDCQISVTCKELAAGLWFNSIPSAEKLWGFHTNSPGTRGTTVLFTGRVSAPMYHSVPKLGELSSLPESMSPELSFSPHIFTVCSWAYFLYNLLWPTYSKLPTATGDQELLLK